MQRFYNGFAKRKLIKRRSVFIHNMVTAQVSVFGLKLGRVWDGIVRNARAAAGILYLLKSQGLAFSEFATLAGPIVHYRGLPDLL